MQAATLEPPVKKGPHRFQPKPGGPKHLAKSGRKTEPKILANGEPDWSHLQKRVMLSRQRFIYEYLKDYNGADAMRRLGYEHHNPGSRANDWLKEPYTAWLLRKAQDSLTAETVISQQEIVTILKKEAYNTDPLDASSATRINAAKALAKIMGMEITKIEGNINVGGSVMVVPFSGSLEDWEKQTRGDQKKLKMAVKA